MKIGIDLDEVLADFTSAIIKFHNKTFNTSFQKDHLCIYEFWKIWGGTEKGMAREIDEFYKSHYFENIKPIPGSKIGVNVLSKKHDLKIITARQNYIADKTKKWLNNHFANKFSEIHFANHYSPIGKSIKKSEICLKLDIDLVIEDSLEYAKDCISVGKNVLLFDCPWNQSEKLPKNIKRVYSWKEIVESIG